MALSRLGPAYHEPVGACCKITVTFIDAIQNLVLPYEGCRIA